MHQIRGSTNISGLTLVRGRDPQVKKKRKKKEKKPTLPKYLVDILCNGNESTYWLVLLAPSTTWLAWDLHEWS